MDYFPHNLKWHFSSRLYCHKLCKPHRYNKMIILYISSIFRHHSPWTSQLCVHNLLVTIESSVISLSYHKQLEWSTWSFLKISKSRHTFWRSSFWLKLMWMTLSWRGVLLTVSWFNRRTEDYAQFWRLIDDKWQSSTIFKKYLFFS